MTSTPRTLSPVPSSAASIATPTKPDLRAGLVTIAAMAVGSAVVRSTPGSVLASLFVLALYPLLGAARDACKPAAAYGLLLLAQRLCVLGGALPLVPFLGIARTLVVKAYPIYIIGWLVLRSLPTGEVMAAMQTLRVPGTLLVVLIVVYRYVPTLVGEIRVIRSGARLRHTRPAWRRWARHPVVQCEHLVMPVLMRTGRIADELAAVALCKDLDPGRRRSSMVEPRIQPLDAALALSCIAVVVLLKLSVG